MGAGLSVVVNVVQILSFAVQLVQAGPDLIRHVPEIVRGGRARTRELMSECEESMQD
jgi:hypothetical protein